ncbi:hypothetical protein BGX31_003914 [Mortierella sp. GBA43]|nr:hypothetical protein BGX31_003914 [Mortierella sp. GBA43]
METRSKRRAPANEDGATAPKKQASASVRRTATAAATAPLKRSSSSGTKKDVGPKSKSEENPKDEGKPKGPKREPSAVGAPHVNVDGTRTSVWLMKSEPHTFSIDALISSKNSTSHWEGVRNHEAKNLMKNSMQVGDQVLFYHSNTKDPGIVALAKVVKEAYPDHTAFDPKSDYYDEKSDKDDPRWFMVDVQFVRKLNRILSLKELQQHKDKELKDMKLLNRGRLSVQPVSNTEMAFIMELEKTANEEQ